jgi:hypothetical protein
MIARTIVRRMPQSVSAGTRLSATGAGRTSMLVAGKGEDADGSSTAHLHSA